MKIIRKINNIDYELAVGRNCEIGKQLEKDYDGYSLQHSYDGYVSTIFFKSRSFFGSQTKNIGKLFYDHDTDVVTYKKYGFNKENHEFKTTKSIGFNWDIISNLKAKDIVQIESKEENNTILYTISVSKILKYQDFKYFKSLGYEKQIFVPICEFKKIVKDTKGKRSVPTSYKKRKRNN